MCLLTLRLDNWEEATPEIREILYKSWNGLQWNNSRSWPVPYEILESALWYAGVELISCTFSPLTKIIKAQVKLLPEFESVQGLIEVLEEQGPDLWMEGYVDFCYTEPIEGEEEEDCYVPGFKFISILNCN